MALPAAPGRAPEWLARGFVLVAAALAAARQFLPQLLRADSYSGDLSQHVWWTARFADPGLLPLAENGGLTQTMALTSDSPALDVGGECPEADQRGMPRSGACDAGAYEYQP